MPNLVYVNLSMNIGINLLYTHIRTYPRISDDNQ